MAYMYVHIHQSNTRAWLAIDIPLAATWVAGGVGNGARFWASLTWDHPSCSWARHCWAMDLACIVAAQVAGVAESSVCLTWDCSSHSWAQQHCWARDLAFECLVCVGGGVGCGLWFRVHSTWDLSSHSWAWQCCWPIDPASEAVAGWVAEGVENMMSQSMHDAGPFFSFPSTMLLSKGSGIWCSLQIQGGKMAKLDWGLCKMKLPWCQQSCEIHCRRNSNWSLGFVGIGLTLLRWMAKIK